MAFAGFRNSGCRNCCGGGCTIFSDLFPVDNLAADYTISSGSWSVSGGVLTTGSTGALITVNTAGTTGHGHVNALAKVDTSGATVRLVGAYSDDNNYVYSLLTINGGSSTFELWQRVLGVDSQLGSTFTFTGGTGSFYALSLCWNGTDAVASMQDFSAMKLGFREACTLTGNKVGLGANPNGGTATFDNIEFKKHYDDDAACGDCEFSCGRCDNNTGANMIQALVVLADIVDGANGCDELNGSYLLDFVWNKPLGVGFNCLWRYVFPTAVCGIARIELELDSTGSPNYYTVILYSTPSGIGGIVFGWQMNMGGGDNLVCDSTEQQTDPGGAGTDAYVNATATYSFPF